MRFFNKIIFGVFIQAIFISPLHADDQLPINALWNASDGFGIWLYSKSGACPEIRNRVKAFVVISFKEKMQASMMKHLELSDLSLCASFIKGNPLSKCSSAQIDIRYDESTKEYFGSFQLHFENSTEKEGEFRAAYCEPSK